MSSIPVLHLEDVTRTYVQGGSKLHVLRNASLTIAEGEVVALVGPSGSGKTTLLQVTGLLDTPTNGEVTINGRNYASASEGERTHARRNDIGFVYQFHHLLRDFTAVENVTIPQLITGKKEKVARCRAVQLLESMGLGSRLDHLPSQLSGGEQQRVAIARALANEPKLLLADEPTGNLDPTTAEEVFTHLVNTVKEHKLAALVATHNMELAARMHRVVQLKDGRIL